MQVNRYLKNKAMDKIDHALGRPANPKSPTYRNRFCVDTDSTEADAFRASPHWTEGRSGFGSTLFWVNEHGRDALYEHLREIGDKHRLFVVTYQGTEMTPVASTSHAAAKYDAWLKLDWCDLPFGEFVRETRVRLAG
ncbi:hypothetical protein RA27_02130 [Ruegeria sp. ANG-R]|uniref:hypothetical protein n=1 Tax=Ruegeria sp. ANG-R TaxID=1577903 RepID=UPI00057F19FA|nr:hypothetical protein [Ruegeria sp. ANG-R]KIC42214.1 hypothetical protein RA27_02130 [Ruegeria sp. ANG-R]